MAIKIDRYYDIHCSRCGKYRGTDYRGGLESTANTLRLLARIEGWTKSKGLTLCPICAKEAANGK